MNFLAHAYLSGNNEDLLLGNFIADALKGNSFPFFTPDMIKGVQVHRMIDEYTDSHPVVLESKKRLRPHFSKYAPVIVDIFYDHFLAFHWKKYSDIPLADYTAHVYAIVDKHMDILPEEVGHFFPYMKKNDWLLNYGNMEGLQRVFNGMSRRASFVSLMEEAPAELQVNYNLYQEEFFVFFEDLRLKAKEWVS